MTRRLIVFGLVGLLIAVIVGAGYLFLTLRNQNPGSTNPVTDFFSALFPFGATSPATNGSIATNPAVTAAEKVVTQLRKVTDKPVAGGWFVAAAATTSPTNIRFMDRATGHITETPVDSYAETRLSNTTVPGIQDLAEASTTTFIFRTIPDGETIQNFFGTLNATSSEQSISTEPLKGFKRFAITPGGSSMITVSETTGGSLIETSGVDGTNQKTLLISPIRSWVPFASKSGFFLQTAPSSGVPGFLYSITKAGGFIKVIGDISGLSSLPSPSGRYVLFSGASGTHLTLAVLDTKTSQEYTLPLGTLAEKCVWVSEDVPLIFCGVPGTAKGTSLPDDWLLGRVAFSDGAWLMHPLQGTAYFIGNLATMATVPVDVVHPSVSPDGNYVLFINKNDLSLWSLNIQTK